MMPLARMHSPLFDLVTSTAKQAGRMTGLSLRGHGLLGGIAGGDAGPVTERRNACADAGPDAAAWTLAAGPRRPVRPAMTDSGH